MRVPYTQQFSPKQTPLWTLLAILRQHDGDRSSMRTAIHSAFFKALKGQSPKVAGNTLISLKAHGVIDRDGKLTPFGSSLASSPDEAHAIRTLARHILLDLDGVAIVETLKEMKSAGQRITLTSLPTELRKRGLEASDNSSDLSGVLNWLEAARIVKRYEVDEGAYASLAGMDAGHVGALKMLSAEQLSFLRALVALGPKDYVDHSEVFDHAEGLYPGLVRYNRKTPEPTVLRPLVKLGFIELRRRDKASPGARGGKATEVRATAKLKSELADKLLAALARAAGFAQVREIGSKSWADIVRDVEEGKDDDTRGRGLELLTIKLCQTLDLDFLGWRQTDEAITAGGEVDAMFHSSRLVYSRWQVQCKNSRIISYEALAKEIGVVQVTCANVILIASTGEATKSARMLRDRVVRSSSLNIIFLEGHHLKRIIERPSEIVSILSAQAQEALRIKGTPPGLEKSVANDGQSNGKGARETVVASTGAAKADQTPNGREGKRK